MVISDLELLDHELQDKELADHELQGHRLQDHVLETPAVPVPCPPAQWWPSSSRGSAPTPSPSSLDHKTIGLQDHGLDILNLHVILHWLFSPR